MYLLQIYSSIIGEIDDATMASYTPTYGDRIATRHFCIEKQRRGDDPKRLSFFEKCIRKMGTMRKLTKLKLKLRLCHKLKICSFPMKSQWMGNCEFSHDIVNFQEAQVDEDVSVGEYYETHKLGLFYLFTKTLANVVDPKEGADMQTGDKAAESGHNKHTMEEVEQLTSTRDNTGNQINTVAGEDQRTAIISVVSTAAGQIIDLTSLSNTSEVIFGALTSGPLFGDLDVMIDSYMSQSLQLKRNEFTPPLTGELLLILRQLLLDHLTVLSVNLCK